MKNITWLAVFVLGFNLLASTTALAQSGISEGYCSTGESILEGSIFELRQEGMPIDTARDEMDSFMNTNMTFWKFMIQSVNTLYADPDDMRSMLRSGKWNELCVKTVRGF